MPYNIRGRLHMSQKSSTFAANLTKLTCQSRNTNTKCLTIKFYCYEKDFLCSSAFVRKYDVIRY